MFRYKKVHYILNFNIDINILDISISMFHSNVVPVK